MRRFAMAVTAALAVTMCAQVYVADANDKRQRGTIESRVAALEKENAKLRRSLEDGKYRMSDIEGDCRELFALIDQHKKRLGVGKVRMREIEERITANLDRIMKHHPKK